MLATVWYGSYPLQRYVIQSVKITQKPHIYLESDKSVILTPFQPFLHYYYHYTILFAILQYKIRINTVNKY